MNILPQEVANRRIIGSLDGQDVYQIGLKGGLFILAKASKGQLEVIGSGPHRLVAQHVARKLHPRLIITELLKSEGVQEAHFIRQVPYYVELTNRLNSVVNG